MLSYIKIEDYFLWQNLLTSFENKERMQNRIYIYVLSYMCYVPASVAQLDAHPTGDQEVAGSTPARLATFFRWDWSGNIFYGHSLPSADSRRAVVSFWRKNVHNTG